MYAIDLMFGIFKMAVILSASYFIITNFLGKTKFDCMRIWTIDIIDFDDMLTAEIGCDKV